MRWLGFLLLLTSCVTTQKAEMVLKKKGKLAEICAETYPVKDSTVYLESTVFDTLYVPEVWVEYDTVIENKTIKVAVPCPAQKTIVKTVRKDSIIYRRNTAQEAHLGELIKQRDQIINECSSVLDSKDKALKGCEDSKNKWKRRTIFSWLLILALLAWMNRKTILRLIGRI